MSFVKSESVDGEWERGYNAARENFSQLLANASENIAQLEAEIERLQAYAKHERSLGAEGPMIELISAKQEIVQLRALLQEITEYTMPAPIMAKVRRELERRRG